MHKKYKARHYLTHTLSHLLGVSAVVTLAMTIGYFASAEITVTAPLSTTTPSPTLTSIPALTTGDLVSFAATPAPETDCEGITQPMTRVFFAVSTALGGSFEVTSDMGMSNARFEWGEYPLPNGNYVWHGVVNSGFTSASGSDSGSFELRGTCPLPLLNTHDRMMGMSHNITPEGTALSGAVAPPLDVPLALPTSTASSVLPAPAVPPTQIIPRPILKVFFDNKPVTDPSSIFDDEDIELRVIISLAKKVNLVAINNDTHAVLQLGNGVIDDLLTTPGMDIWSYVWSASNIPAGTYKVFARVLHTDGTTIDTVPALLTIAHHPHMPMMEMRENGMHTFVATTPNERQKILDRVSDPAKCTNAEECKIFCARHPDTKDQCTQFARVHLGVSTVRPPSLTDGVSDGAVIAMLRDPRKRPKALPEIIVTADDFNSYCAQSEHGELCTHALFSNDLASKEALAQKTSDVDRAREEEKKLFVERVGARAFIDTDDDGVTDYDEVNIYRTDPIDLDTDHDGFLDGAEILAGTNPRGLNQISIELAPSLFGTSSMDVSRASEEVNVENPLIAGTPMPALLSVTSVLAIPVGLGEKGTTTVTKLKLSGKALSNSFVRLYIFSDPIVVTVKADDTGVWTYTLDKELSDGTHQVISAITDSSGHILAKSQSLPFIKEAAAVSIDTALLPTLPETQGFLSDASLYALIAIILALFGLGLSVIGFMVYRRGDTDEPTKAL